MKHPKFRWYRIKGVSYKDDAKATVDTVFVYIIEAQSRHNVIKYHGGKRTCENQEGVRIVAYFPKKEVDVEVLPESWKPDFSLSSITPGDTSLVIKIIPAVRYECEHCGKIRFSDYRYPYMWCNCSNKSFPVEDADMHLLTAQKSGDAMVHDSSQQ